MLFLLLLFSQAGYSQYNEKFFTTRGLSFEKSQAINLSIVRDTTLTLTIPSDIVTFSLSGKAKLESWENGYIRVTIADKSGHEYLVYDLYPLLADSLTSILNHVCLETYNLVGEKPTKLNIRVSNAVLQLDEIHFAESETLQKMNLLAQPTDALQNQQAYIVDKLNRHLGARNIPWRAGKTPISDLSYEEKKAIYGNPLPVLGGYEYYNGGIFIMPGTNLSEPSNRSGQTYVAEFDWRNRHGKNWITAAKDQGWCQSCWIFAAVGTIEAYTNLYYNRLLNYDLSEQEIMMCINNDTLSYYTGLNNYVPCASGYCRNAYTYVYRNGLTTEDCLPYYVRQKNDPIIGSCDDKCDLPTELIRISKNAKTSYNTRIDTLKKHLFSAPLSISIREVLNDSLQPSSYPHALLLIGYKEIQVGDSLLAGYNHFQTITSDSPYAGKTVWICKESSGQGFGENGFVNMILNSNSIMRFNYLDCDIQSMVYANDSILVTDADGDGYFFWGVGPKPAHCPSWIPEEPDGDDSDYSKGPIDEYGWLRDLAPDQNDTLYVDVNTTWDTYRFQHHHVCIRNNATLTVSNTVKCYQDVSFTIQSDATLLVDGGTLDNVQIVPLQGAKVQMIHGGHIIPCSNTTFSFPLGAELLIDYGQIK